MTRLALGTAQFGLAYGIANQHGRLADDEVDRVLACARTRDVDMLDTAVAYGDSERRLGLSGVSTFSVVSKLPALPAERLDVGAWVHEQVRASLDRLRIPRLYGLLLHRPAQLLEPVGDRLFDALLSVRSAGLTRKIGASVYDPAELGPITARYRLDLVQAPINVFDRRLIETGWLACLRRAGVEVHGRSVFLQGVLLMPASARPAKFNRWTPLWARWDDWLQRNGLTPLQACLRYALSHPDLARIVVGVDTARQLEELLDAAQGTLPEMPANLGSEDDALINPSKWDQL